jgi:hypothetical protein
VGQARARTMLRPRNVRRLPPAPRPHPVVLTRGSHREVDAGRMLSCARHHVSPRRAPLRGVMPSRALLRKVLDRLSAPAAPSGTSHT